MPPNNEIQRQVDCNRKRDRVLKERLELGNRPELQPGAGSERVEPGALRPFLTHLSAVHSFGNARF